MSICHHNRTESDCPTCSKFYSKSSLSKAIPTTGNHQNNYSNSKNVDHVWFEYRHRLAHTLNIILIAACGLAIVLTVIAAQNQ